jgi:hypothetical protein
MVWRSRKRRSAASIGGGQVPYTLTEIRALCMPGNSCRGDCPTAVELVPIHRRFIAVFYNVLQRRSKQSIRIRRMKEENEQ